MAKLLAVLAVLSVSLSTPRPAEACSCPPPPEDAFPLPGASGVPLDVRPFYRGPSSQTLTLHAGDVLVPTARERQREFVELTPEAPLLPLTVHELRDEGRVIASFTTGEVSGSGPPPAPQIAGLGVKRAFLDGGRNSCVDGDAVMFVDLDFAPVESTAYSLRSSYQGGTVAEKWLLADELARLDGGPSPECGPQLVIVDHGNEGCVEIAARGADGQLSAYTTRCATIEACQPVPMDGPYECLAPTTSLPASDDSGGCRTTRGDGGWALVMLALLALRRQMARSRPAQYGSRSLRL